MKLCASDLVVTPRGHDSRPELLNLMIDRAASAHVHKGAAR